MTVKKTHKYRKFSESQALHPVRILELLIICNAVLHILHFGETLFSKISFSKVQLKYVRTMLDKGFWKLLSLFDR